MQLSIRQLEWDSAFFNKSIGKVEIDRFEQDYGQLEYMAEFDLFYLYSQEPIDETNLLERLKDQNFKMVFEEEKLVYSIPVTPSAGHWSMENIKQLDSTYEADLDLINLALGSGEYSRFRLCPILKEKFETLYVLWLAKSLQGTLSDAVFGYIESDIILGFVTCKKAGSVITIGLISVAPQARGKGIGNKLLKTALAYATRESCIAVEVSTQGVNRTASAFYEAFGFELSQRRHLYHFHNENTI